MASSWRGAAALSSDLASCFADDGESGNAAEATAQATDAIVAGTADTTENAQFPATVWIPSQGCSGTLVTPYWVMTAEHCYEDLGEVSMDDAVQLGAGGQKVVAHTNATSGPIRLWEADSFRETDIALVRLDERAPVPYALPAPPPRTTNSCGNSLPGRLVGFGPAAYNENGYPVNGSYCPFAPPDGTRRYGIAKTWARDHDPPGTAYQHIFTSAPGEACTEMAGIGVGGDSGGWLYRTSDGQFCGVISGDGGWHCSQSPIYPFTLSCDYHTAAVDDGEAIAWWSQYLLDVDGEFEGTIPATPANDPDGDGIASLYDNCPLVHNPEQLTTFDDPDGNGIGAACDACPGFSALSQIPNRNFEVELALAYPTRTSAPVVVLRRSDYASDAAFAQARAERLDTFRPDVCDPYPAPMAKLQSGGDLPSSLPGSSTDPSNWPCLNYTGGCSVVTHNRIKVTPLSSPQVQAAGNPNERIGLRWCDCKGVEDFDDSVMGRAKCRNSPQADCQFNPGAYGVTNTRWQKLTTKNGSTWSNAPVGQEWVVPANSAPFFATWDFGALPAGAVETDTNFRGVRGMLWTHVVELSTSVPDLEPTHIKRYANALSDGSATQALGPNGRLWVAVNDWIDCPMCGFGVEQVLLERGNPWFRKATPQGLDVLEVSHAATREHFDAVAEGTRLHVSASEPPSLLASQLASGQALVRAVGLRSDGSLVSQLGSDGFESLPLASELSGSGGPSFFRGEGLAFSALEQRLYVLGGLGSSGQPTNKGWFFDLPNTTWRSFDMPAGETVGQVLAMSYRHVDRAIYFLDKSGTTLRLRRWHAQRKLDADAIVTLATFPSSWSAFGKYALALGPTGDLGIVAYRGTSTTKTLLGRFTLSPAHRISTAELSSLTTQILGPPALTPLGFAYTVDAATPYAQTLAFTAMPTAWRTNAPTIGAH